MIQCIDLNAVSQTGMNIEEYTVISNCNGMFTEFYRPDIEELQTVESIKINLEERKKCTIDCEKDLSNFIKENINKNNSFFKVEIFSEEAKVSKVIQHNHNFNCKNSNRIVPKKANLNFFRVAIHTTTRRLNFQLVTNSSRKVLKQTGSGHYSPIVSYNLNFDGILMLDVARFKYFSMWVKIQKLWESLIPKDNLLLKPRGFCLSSRYH